MLHQLISHAEKMGLVSKPGFISKDVQWCIDCDASGALLGIVEIGDLTARKNPGKSFPLCPNLSQGEMIAGGMPDEMKRCHFLVETADVVCLCSKDSPDPKVEAKHRFFITLLEEAAAVMPELAKIASLLRQPATLAELQSQFQERKASPTAKVTFRIGGSFPVESTQWHSWWDDFRKAIPSKKKGKDSRDSQLPCLVDGMTEEAMRTHPKIKGLASVGGAMAGDVLIGFDKSAFESFNLSQSYNSAVCEEHASAYVTSLNDLIKNHSSRLAGAKVVHWFKKEILPEDDPLPWLEEMTQDDEGKSQERDAQFRARQLLESIRTGKKPELQGNYYYALTLSGASGRVMVRDWMEGQFEELVENIALWFDDFEIVHREGCRSAPSPKFLAVLSATVRDLDDLAAPFVAKMWRVAVRGELIPETALAKAVARTRVDIIEDKSLNHARMGLMKAYHVRKNRINRKEQTMTPCLNEQHPSAAYHCGRLMAVMAALQRAALGDVGAGVVQRYYAAASATPALVIGRLVRTSQFHLNKLEGGLAHWYENKLAGISCNIGDNIPPTLTLEEQSLFALGYYQQLADLRTKKIDKDNDEKENTNE